MNTYGGTCLSSSCGIGIFLALMIHMTNKFKNHGNKKNNNKYILLKYHSSAD